MWGSGGQKSEHGLGSGVWGIGGGSIGAGGTGNGS